MSIGAYFSLSSLIIIIILSYMYFSKQRVENSETKIYGKLLIITMLGLSLEIFTCIWFNYEADINGIMYKFISKLTSSYYAVWSGLFVIYLMNICKTSEKTKSVFKKILMGIFVLIMLLPLSYDTSSGSILPIGPSIYFTYFACFIFTFIDLYYCLRYRKKIVNSKFTPVYSLMILGTIAIVLGVYFPSLFLIGYVYSLIVIIMYFTIENPDVKLLNQMELAKNEAERANRAKSDFLSSMSHEIRTPLNAIVGLSEDNLRYEDKLPPEIIENSKDIMNASETLLEIVGNILDINKIEADKMEIVETNYNFKEEITNMCKVTSTRIGEKNVKFILSFADDIPYELIGDRGKVKEIINNLLTNAIKYTEEGTINLNIKCINDMRNQVSKLIITCKDTGKGIKKEYIDRLFTKFDRLDVEKNTTTEGTGLGLAITKNLVEMMGGKINVQSEYGDGSVFVVTIPQKISIMSRNNKKEGLKETKEIDYKGKKVLIVDDNKLNIKVASKALKEFDFIIDECYDGNESIDKVKNNNYDLILMDIMMPGMNGEEALKELKKLKDFNTPVIALTADAVSGSKEKYERLGFKGYLSKPFSKELLKQKLDEIFSEKEPSKLTKPVKEINKEYDEDILKYENIEYEYVVKDIGSLELYREELSKWLETANEKLEELKLHKLKHDMKSYEKTLDILKEDSNRLGFLVISSIVNKHKIKIDEEDIDYINKDFNYFEKEYINVINTVEKYLNK